MILKEGSPLLSLIIMSAESINPENYLFTNYLLFNN